MAISTFMYIIFGATIAYLIVIGIITLGWHSLSKPNIDEKNINPFVSIVIAVRNESKNIAKLIEQLKNQSYHHKNYEIIIIDDHSDDDTAGIISAIAEKNTEINLRLISSTGNGKKTAVKQGITAAKSEIILTTDGDCSVSSFWISTMVSYLTTGYRVITGPVVYNKEKKLITRFFELDFLSLVASGAGSIGAKLPLMGNAANMAFYKKDYVNLMTNNPSNKYISGDDVFFIHEIYQKYDSKTVGFVKEEKAIVSTDGPENLSSFLSQRTRWASKAVGYSIIWPVIVAIIVFGFNLLIATLMVICTFFPVLLPVYFLMIITKFVIDAPLLRSAISFTKKTHLKILILLFEFVYPIYIVIAAIKSFTGIYTWKGRTK